MNESAGREPHAARDEDSTLSPEPQSLNVAKLMLIGDGFVGKTSLAMRLLGQSFCPTPQVTTGVQISQLSAKVGSQLLRLNIWDVGGQQILYSTHQMFLSPASIYVIVLEARGAANLERWLEATLALGKDSPILVVINKTDQAAHALDERRLADRYPSIAGFHRVSCLTGHGIAALTEAIWDCARDLPHFSAVMPSSWIQVSRAVEEMTRDYIDQDEFSDLCVAHGIESQKEQLGLLQLLHELGFVFYFPGIALQLLNPTWVTSAIDRILESSELRSSGGILDFTRLRRVLGVGAQPTYDANERRAILEIMKRFDLCHEGVPAGTVLIPSLLPDAEPEFNFDCRTAAAIHCEYVFLPASVFFRLLVRLHKHVIFEQRWKTGAVFRGRNHVFRVLIRSERSLSAIQVWLDGKDRWKAWDLLRSCIDAISSSLDCIELRVVVPCKCDVCRKRRRPHKYLLRSLLARVDQGKKFATCENSDTRVSLTTLLPSYVARSASLVDSRARVPVVFLSYSTKDFAVVARIAADMRELGIPYWLDIEQIKPGDSVSKALDHALRVAPTIVACLSENQLTSGWSRAEYASALANSISVGNKRVVPLIIDDLSQERIPPLLRDLRAVRLGATEEYRAFLEGLRCEVADSNDE